jgi:hypothetical protein
MFSGLRVRAKSQLNQRSGEPVRQWLNNAKMAAVSDQPLYTNVSQSAADTDPVLERKSSTLQVVYLAAIAAATAGWLWLVARILMWAIPL